MPQPLSDPINPRTLPAPSQRGTWLAYFLPGHPWNQNPSGRPGLVATQGLSEHQIDVLLAEYAERERWYPEAGRKRGSGWTGWIQDVLLTRVQLLPAGRASLINPREPFPGLVVTLRFSPTGKRRGREPEIMLERVEVTSSSHPPSPLVGVIDLSTYWAALLLETERIKATTKGRGRARDFFGIADRPEPGKPPKTDYYELLLREYEALAKDGHRAPARELAERYGINRATVRTHLATARRLREQREGGNR